MSVWEESSLYIQLLTGYHQTCVKSTDLYLLTVRCVSCVCFYFHFILKWTFFLQKLSFTLVDIILPFLSCSIWFCTVPELTVHIQRITHRNNESFRCSASLLPVQIIVKLFCLHVDSLGVSVVCFHIVFFFFLFLTLLSHTGSSIQPCCRCHYVNRVVWS